MIQDLDETLRGMLAAELAKIPGCPVREASQITFEAPVVVEGNDDRTPRLNLYLHDVRENVALRDESFHRLRGNGSGQDAEWQRTRGPAGQEVGVRRAPARLDISYLITAHAGGEAAIEHRLLSDVLAVLMRFAVVPEGYLKGSLEGAGPRAVILSTAQPEQTAHADAATLWQALGGRLRPALGLVVTAPFNPFETKWTRVVREALVGLGQGTPPHGPVRPLDMAGTRVSAAGVVVQEDGEQPLAEVLVSVVGRDEKAQSDARGFFYLLDLPPGRHTLRLSKPGYAPREQEVVAQPPGRADQLEPLVIARPPLDDMARSEEVARLAAETSNLPARTGTDREVYHVSLSGILRRADGQPAAYVPVRVGRHRTTTDANGVYWFYNLPAEDHALTVDVPGYGEVEMPVRDRKGIAAGPLTLPALDADGPSSSGTEKKSSVKSTQRTAKT